MERERLVERAAEMGRVLAERLAPLARHPNVAEVRGLGLLQAVEFVRDRRTLEPFPKEMRFASRITAAALAHGAFLYPGGCDPARDVVCFGPPFTIAPAEIDLAVGALEKALADVLARA
jgi:L-2,4-diaminobutyrate transaminase